MNILTGNQSHPLNQKANNMKAIIATCIVMITASIIYHVTSFEVSIIYLLSIIWGAIITHKPTNNEKTN